MPTSERDDHRPRLEDQPAVREREARPRRRARTAPWRGRGPGRAPIDRREHAHRRAPRGSPTAAPGGAMAPSVRSVANSRVRWAIVIESELTITNAPTNSAMPAEREQEGLQEARGSSFVSFASSGACSSPVLHLRAGRQDRRGSARRARCGETPGFAADADLVELALLVEQLLRGGEVEARQRRAADVEAAEPNSTSPETRSGSHRAARLDADRVAHRDVLLAAVERVDHDLVRGRASVPLRQRQRVEPRLRGVDAEAEVRRAAERDRPCRSCRSAARSPADAADRRLPPPAAPRTFASSDSSNDGVPASLDVVARCRTRTCR